MESLYTENGHCMKKHIAILGPESTGKSTLCEALAKHFSATCIPEYSRSRTEILSGDYVIENLDEIALAQFSASQKPSEGLIFEDTEQINMKVWMEEKFGVCSEEVLTRIELHSPDFYLLTLPDIEWDEDPLRVNPDKREYLFSLYKAELLIHKIPFAIIDGRGDQRLRNAIFEVEKYLNSEKIY